MVSLGVLLYFTTIVICEWVDFNIAGMNWYNDGLERLKHDTCAHNNDMDTNPSAVIKSNYPQGYLFHQQVPPLIINTWQTDGHPCIGL